MVVFSLCELLFDVRFDFTKLANHVVFYTDRVLILWLVINLFVFTYGLSWLVLVLLLSFFMRKDIVCLWWIYLHSFLITSSLRLNRAHDWQALLRALTCTTTVMLILYFLQINLDFLLQLFKFGFSKCDQTHFQLFECVSGVILEFINPFLKVFHCFTKLLLFLVELLVHIL